MANPFQWASYTAPTMTPVAGSSGNFNFYQPTNSQLPTGQALGNFLMPQGAATDPMTVNNRTVKHDGGLTREMIGNSTSFLNQQLGQGFGDLTDQLQYGGAFGDRNSPVYSPTSQNGYGTGWGGNNPFKIGSF